MSRALPSLLAIGAVAAVGVPLWMRLVAREAEPPVAPRRERGPTPVTVIELVRRDLAVEVTAFGSLLPARTATLAVESSGRVAWVRDAWRPGARVEVGDELLRLDVELQELELETRALAVREAEQGLALSARERLLAVRLQGGAQRALELAQREEGRLAELLDRGRLSESLVDGARSTLVRAEGELETANARVETATLAESAARTRLARARVAERLAAETVERASLRAPFDGHLVGRAPALGTFVVAGAPLTDLADLSELHLRAMVHEDELAPIRVGLPAHVELPSRPGLVLAGRVRAIEPVADVATRSAAVEIAVPNPAPADASAGESAGPSLPAGLFARATVDAGTESGVLWIDRAHLEWSGERAFAFVLEGDRARRRELVLGSALGEGFAVRSGLAVGELLITGPLDRVEEGTPCRLAGDRPGGGAAR